MTFPCRDARLPSSVCSTVNQNVLKLSGSTCLQKLRLPSRTCSSPSFCKQPQLTASDTALQGVRQGRQTDFTRVQHLSLYTHRRDDGTAVTVDVEGQQAPEAAGVIANRVGLSSVCLALEAAGVRGAVPGRELVWPCSSEVAVCRRHMRLLGPLSTGGVGGKLIAQGTRATLKERLRWQLEAALIHLDGGTGSA